jgi:hypothetical protein
MISVLSIIKTVDNNTLDNIDSITHKCVILIYCLPNISIFLLVVIKPVFKFKVKFENDQPTQIMKYFL